MSENLCAACGEPEGDDAMQHQFLHHHSKTVCYSCPECGHCECDIDRFKDHVTQHPQSEGPWSFEQYTLRSEQPFESLNKCKICSYQHLNKLGLTRHMDSVHRVSQSETGPTQPITRTDGQFPDADRELRLRAEACKDHLDDVTAALERAKVRHDNRRQQEIYGVSHPVALRGDLLTNRGEAYAHIFVEALQKPGEYTLVSATGVKCDVTIRRHHASPAVIQGEFSIADENPRRLPNSAHLHLARGIPVVWATLSCAGKPVEGLHKLFGTVYMCKVTVDRDRVLQ